MINVVLPIKGKDIAHFHEPQNSPESPLDRYHRCCLAQCALSRTLYCGCGVYSEFRQFSDRIHPTFASPTFFRLANFHPTVFRQFSDSLMSSDGFPTVFRQFSDSLIFIWQFSDSPTFSRQFFLLEVNVEEKSVLLGFHAYILHFYCGILDVYKLCSVHTFVPINT